MRLVGQVAIVVHVFATVALVGCLFFNTLVLMPALKRIPPAHSAVISEKIGAALTWVGMSSLILLGVSGFGFLWAYGMHGALLNPAFWASAYGVRLALMVGAWAVLLGTGTLSAYWYRTVLTRKLPFTAGLRDLEERRAAQERISNIQDRLAAVNLTLGVAAALGGALLRALR